MPRPEGQRCLVTSSRCVTAAPRAPAAAAQPSRPSGPPAPLTPSPVRRGWTTSRTRSGAILHRFPGALPEGSAATQSSPAHACALDAVFCEQRQAYLVLDVLAWRGQQLHECTAEFRRFWLDGTVREELAAAAAALAARGGCVPAAQAPPQRRQQQGRQQRQQGARSQGPGGAGDAAMEDAGAAGGGAAAAAAAAAAAEEAEQEQEQGEEEEQGPALTYTFEVVPAARCTPEGLLAAYQQPVPFARDGLYLLHAEGRYQQGPPCPLALTWKDAACSAYYIDTDARGVVPEHQQVTLALQLDGGVATQDEPPVVLGRMPTQFLARQQQPGGGGGGGGGGARLGPGRLLRFTIRGGGITLHEGRPAGADLHYEGPANQRRGRADLISKVMFQYNARRQPVAVQELLEVAAAGGAGAGAMAEDAAG
jgi:hypothetical protein